MKKIKCLFLAIFFMIFSTFNNSCLGPFKLTHKTYDWNNSIGDKWANNVVFWALLIIPVYEVVVFLDTCIFNVIEFWGGTNPISMNEGDEEIRIVESGNKEYMIKATKNKFHIEQIIGTHKGEWADIIFYPEDNSCYLHYKGEKIKLVEYIHSEDGTDQVNLFLPNGSMISMDANKRNLNVAQFALLTDSHFKVKKD